MKNKKLLLIPLLFSMLFSCTSEPQNENPVHKCKHHCSVCELCTDVNCTDPVCSQKCQGHTKSKEHICVLKCATCGLCRDNACTDPVCLNKCQGHEVITHSCSHICPTCGLCLDATCLEKECSNKCQGHVTPHVCSHVCSDCGGCTDATCHESACSNKCNGHTVAHTCSHVCTTCNKCTDATCTNDVCKDKCQGHVNADLAEKYKYKANIPEKLPQIKITTASTNWATDYNRSSKLNNQIEYVAATVSTDWNGSYVINNAGAQVKVRGNYTLEYPKKPIRIKFDSKQKMFGLNNDLKTKNWVLLADWKDLSMQNNSTAYYLGKQLFNSDGLYSSDIMPVELYINNQYWGMYNLAEQQEAKTGRFELTAASETEVNPYHGYLVEYDGYYLYEDPANGGDYSFTLDYNDGAPVKGRDGQTKSFYNYGYTIKSDLSDPSDVSTIQNYMDLVYTVIYEANYNNKFYKIKSDYSGLEEATFANAYECCNNVCNVQSMVDMFLLNEIACDDDVASSSFYMDCDLNPSKFKKLTFESAWDFDSSFGIKIFKDCYDWWAGNSQNAWYVVFSHADWFIKLVKQKWEEIKKAGVVQASLDNIVKRKNEYVEEYARNYERWESRITGGNFELYSFLNQMTTEGQAADYLYEWLSTRYQALDSLFDSNSVSEQEEEFMKTATKYRLEIESFTLTGGALKTKDANASGGVYLGDITGASFSGERTFTSTGEGTIYIYLGVTKPAGQNSINNCYTISINGKDIKSLGQAIPSLQSGEAEWHTWVSVRLGTATIGTQNTITIQNLSGNNTNLDYVDIYSQTTLTI